MYLCNVFSVFNVTSMFTEPLNSEILVQSLQNLQSPSIHECIYAALFVDMHSIIVRLTELAQIFICPAQYS